MKKACSYFSFSNARERLSNCYIPVRKAYLVALKLKDSFPWKILICGQSDISVSKGQGTIMKMSNVLADDMHREISAEVVGGTDRP